MLQLLLDVTTSATVSVAALVDPSLTDPAVLADRPAPGGVEQGPPAEDVKAGWIGFSVFFGLCAVVALLCWSMVRQLGKARAARDSGVYGDPPPAASARPDPQTPRIENTDHSG